MKRYFLVLAILVIAFPSCKENNTPEPEPEYTVLEYFPLNVGNYWVYERSGCDSTWTDCDLISTDTSIITKDTIINKLVYYKLEGKNITGINQPVYLRDSLDYIVNHTGHIIISNNDFDRIIYERWEINQSNNDTLAHIYNQIKDRPNNVVVPSGTYDCIDFRGSFFRKHDNFQIEYNYHNYFAKDVGPVYRNSMFLHSLGGIKQELISYHIDSE